MPAIASFQDTLSMLRRALGNPEASFMTGQWEAIDAITNRSRRVLLIQRTGWGKSMVYFLATKIFRNQGAGTTLILSPLLSLMRNQIDSASRLGLRACLRRPLIAA